MSFLMFGTVMSTRKVYGRKRGKSRAYLRRMSRKEKKMEKAIAAVMLAVFMIILSGYTIYEYPESTVAVIVVDIIATLQFINNCI